jgi:enamine deaminase RidA (YjgF/YER057c/UK114 family)
MSTSETAEARLTRLGLFTAHPQVADGASRLFADVLGPAGAHARAAIGVAALPLGSPVEVEAIALLRAGAA